MAGLLIVGNAGGTNVGQSLMRASQVLGIDARLVDSREADGSSVWRRRLYWRFADRRSPLMPSFNRRLLRLARASRSGVVLTTGRAPVTAESLSELGAVGVQRLHYSTDDPWNPTQKSSWFLRTLPHYDRIYTTRRANLGDLAAVGCRSVSYLPFGYDPELFHSAPVSDDQRGELASEVVFVGGADADRVPYIRALLEAGVKLALYGDYWNRFIGPCEAIRGYARPETVRQATNAADISLCLVRRANRDGHVMRSFEIPACGGCMVVEDTTEHRALFGEEGQAVSYFASIPDAVRKIRALLANPVERARMAARGHRRVTTGGHQYADRLLTMLAGVRPSR